MNADGQGACKQRFKGVENFLRRIAFNLGNSPSQTEVKIISCIPIDVTDLQQKILDLERLLRRTTKPPAIVHTALCEAGTAGSKIHDAGAVYPIQNTNPDTQKILSYENLDIPDQNDMQPTPCSSANSILDEGNNKRRKSFFKKSKKKKLLKKKHNKVQSHMVYYAQTDNSPFKIQKVVEEKPKMKKEKASKDTNNSFLTDVIRRQYEPLVCKLSASGFSSPVCRDLENSYFTLDPCPSEICSCCRLDFLNIDKNKDSEYFGYTPNFREQIQSNNMYYDSSLYDLVPVKEAPVKHKKNIDIPKRHKHKNGLNFPYCDYGYKPYVHPMCVNYHTIIPTQPVPYSLPRTSPAHKKRRPVQRRLDIRTVAEVTQEDTSNSCRVECGNVYAKFINKKPEPPKRIEIKTRPNYPVTYNNAKTATLQDTECQTTTETQNVETNSIPSQDDKTEETLNQIKTILQSVLTEVKTNTKNKTESEQNAKKDAVVQKGASFGNMQGSSRLLNSFTYSPYNVAPYPPTYSHPMNHGQPWPGVPYPPKCMHNFPVFIQTPGRQPYGSSFRKPSHVSKPVTSRLTSSHATSTQATSGTNTDDNQNYQTDTLIKEIYKSMALNIEPKKETSVSNFSSTPKRTSRTSTKSSFCYGTDKCVSARQPTDNSLPQSLYRRAGPMTSGLTPFTSNMFSNKMTPNTVSVQSHVVSSTDTDRRLRKERLGQYLATTQEMPSEESTARQVMERKLPSTRVGTETSSEESEDDDYEPAMKTEVQKKGRNSLFTKMINSVKLFKNRRRKSQKSKLESEEEEEESDSDDYQTVYSQQMEQARRAPAMQMRRVPHSKVSFSRQMRGRNQEKLRKAAMEQEYRRQWNEQLMFQRQQPYSSGGRSRNSPGFYGQTVETRPIMVEQSVPVRSAMNQDWPFAGPRRVPPAPKPCPHVGPTARGLAWFRKRCKCGENFRSLIVDN